MGLWKIPDFETPRFQTGVFKTGVTVAYGQNKVLAYGGVCVLMLEQNFHLTILQ